jgi:hypothetical protein
VLGDLAEDDEIEGGGAVGQGPRQVHVGIDRDGVGRNGAGLLRQLVIVVPEVSPAHGAAVGLEGSRDLAASRREVQRAQLRIPRQPPRRAQDGLEDVPLRH